MGAEQARRRRRYDAVKRGVDVVVSATGLVVSAPVQLVTAGVVLVAHGRPVLFRQPRPGRDGVVFELVKFRTMRHPDAAHVTDADRLTPVGRFLRSTSLDELPTLLELYGRGARVEAGGPVFGFALCERDVVWSLSLIHI